MSDLYQASYLLGTLFIVLPIWGLLFAHRADLRRQMLTLSIFGALAGPISELFYIQDYWHPPTITGTPIGFEDALFGFCIAGIGAVLYEELLGKRYAKRIDRRHHWSWFLLPLSTLFLATFHALQTVGLNSIYASMFTFVVVALAMLLWRPDLWINSLTSGLLLGGYFFLMYSVFLLFFPDAIHRWWLLSNVSGVLVHGIPVEELLWALSWGALAGPTYEFFSGRYFVDQSALTSAKRS